MPIRFRRDAAINVVLFAALLVANRKLARLHLTPLAQDPCDAVWVFAFVTILFSVAVPLARAFRPHRQAAASTFHCLYIVRSQQGFALALAATLMADAVALAKHRSAWLGFVSTGDLLLWLVPAAIVFSLQWLVIAAKRSLPPTKSKGWRLAALASAIAILLLIACPEWPDYSSQTAHILTVTVGAAVVLIPIRLLLPVLVPATAGTLVGAAPSGAAAEGSALLAGLLIFALGFWTQTHQWIGGWRYFLHPVLVLAPSLITYAFLGPPLGILQKQQLPS